MFANNSSDVAKKYDVKFRRSAKDTESQEDAQEVVRGAFQRAYQQLKEFREESRCLTHMIDTVLNESLRK